MSLCLRERIRRYLLACLALVTVFSLFLLTTVNVHANPVTLDDQAGVLNVGSGQVLNAEGCSDTIDNEAGVLNEERVLAEMAKLDYCMFIYATDRFTGDQDALNKYTRERLPNQNAIAIGIDTVHRNLSIEAGTNVSLSNSEASDAVSTFQSNYKGGDFTGATIAALDSMKNAYNTDVIIGVIIIIIGIVLVVLAVIFIIRAIRRRGGSDGTPRGGGWRRIWIWITTPGNHSSGIYSGDGGGSYGGDSGGGGAGGHF